MVCTIQFLFILLAPCAAVQITPVESVINLLERLEAQTIAEGKEEAAGYDKFACFCKEQADEKLYSITTKNKKISLLTAQVDALTGEITNLNKDIADLNKQISDLQTDCDNAQKARDEAFSKYALRRDDLGEAVRGCDEAIDMLKAGQAPGLIQEKVASLVTKAGQKKPAAGFKFHSGEIVEIMMDTKKKFIINKNDVDAEEAENKHTFDMAQGARFNQIKSLQASLAEATRECTAKENAKGVAEGDKSQTTEDKNSDNTFMDDLTEQCEAKAQAWDTRSKTRSAELTALAGALSTLKGEVSGNYNANKKLVGLVTEKSQVAKPIKGHWVWESDAEQSKDEELEASDSDANMMFLQRSSSRAKGVVVKKVMNYLREQAKNIKSETISALMIRMKEDHFVKVRGMIKDLVSKLKADASAEADQKAWCDSEMEKATSQRDENTAAREGDLAAKDSAESKIARLEEEIAGLLSEISELRKALNEATQLRGKENAENTKTKADATAGLAGVTKAMKILHEFYDNAFVQTSASYKPPKSDADGNTVGDLAPDSFEGDFHGNQDAAVGIIGQLDVIKSDFEANIEATTNAEDDAESAFQAFKTETETDIADKEASVKSKEGEVMSTNGDLADYKDDLHEHSTLKSEALTELAKLKPACVDTGSDYAEGVARREQEIEALKNAYVIFDQMQ